MINLKREDFINQYPPLNHMGRTEIENIWELPCFHLYVHIPFCVWKCGFCYYKSVAAGKKGVPEEYVEAIKTQIKAYASMPELKNRRVRSLYIGGGTPTLLSEEQLNSLLSLIKESFEFTQDFEFCCEARPGSETTLSKLEILKSFGLHRLNLGCQSLDEEILKINGCNHGVEEFYTVFKHAKKVGIRTINTDLLSGLVNETMESFLRTVNGIIELRPENIAIYKMEVYLNSALYKKLRDGSIKLMSDKEEEQHTRMAFARFLEAGYLQADHFSFYTGPEHDHVHRRGQWLGEDLLGVGASSYSRINSHLFQNESRVDVYINKISQGELPIVRAHKISQKEKMIQRVVLSLKNLKISRAEFLDEFGVDLLDVFPDQFTQLSNEGFLNIYEDRIESTFEGTVFADDIAKVFYLPEHRSMMLGHAKRSEECVV